MRHSLTSRGLQLNKGLGPRRTDTQLRAPPRLIHVHNGSCFLRADRRNGAARLYTQRVEADWKDIIKDEAVLTSAALLSGQQCDLNLSFSGETLATSLNDKAGRLNDDVNSEASFSCLSESKRLQYHVTSLSSSFIFKF